MLRNMHSQTDSIKAICLVNRQQPHKTIRHLKHRLKFSPVICNTYNSSMIDGVLPFSLIQCIISPIPKYPLPSSIESDLRPIALRSQISKIMEGFTLKQILSYLDGSLDRLQFATKGHSKPWCTFSITSWRHLIEDIARYVLCRFQEGI